MVAAAIAASVSRRMRVGTAGVLLRYTSPVQVAQAFRLLECNFPGRIDLGVARATAGDAVLERLLFDGRPPQAPPHYRARLEELIRLVEGRPGGEVPVADVPLGPGTSTIPEVWICGSSADSAVVAGELGVCYAYHAYIGRGRGGASDENPIRVYWESFRPCGLLERPRDNVTVYGACAASDGEARRLWDLLTRSPSDGAGDAAQAGPSPCFLGEPRRVRDQLLQLREHYGTDELVVNCAGCDVEESIAGYGLIAAAMGLRLAA
jgi:alkanesulfonate monooxygenase SsuD/methylene tetrahydromethanopterin reductase-like flavin-dependent oxidoreductase (luciferase family)